MLKQIGIFKDNIDNSIKSVYENNKNIIEMTLLFNKKDIDTICVPSHYYCNLGCKICHLTSINTSKAMLPITIDNFINSLELSLKNKNNKRRTNNKKLLISFMGVGDILLNLKLLQDIFEKEEYIKNKLGYNYISYAISTMMPNNNIEKIIKLVEFYEVALKVHYSLHNPFDSKRKELIPNSNIINIDALKLLKKYNNIIINNNKIMKVYKLFHNSLDVVEIHYTLIKNINDSDYCLKELIYLLTLYPINIKFIIFNSTSDMTESDKLDIWIKTLSKLDIKVKKYSPPGKNIGSSCGEFTKYYYIDDKKSIEKEFIIWKNKYEIYQ